ncbi:tRNA (guanosine(37)-N1)-methyltransferase TrmD [Arcanobacterium haemolyticum]|nr:tRNA (guanosine(37)-N1)-methyltransferase TrmD [Arcanobacterium haemolyticum]
MRFDILSVFPEFFDVLSLSLVGKAQERGILDIHSHDLRSWTDDPHRTVDDTPAGGGAGMVMKPDVWGEALDEILEPFTPGSVLAIPTPSGVPLTQRVCEDLAAHATHIAIACGRYEGIDARVAEHYRSRGVRVVEYSLGDYVLNGGEVAAVALIEAVGRLLPGMVGNPESLVEESHGSAGLLEYPVYTRPVVWREQEIPSVLMSGDHGAIAAWRRSKAIAKTIERRPDMVEALETAALSRHDVKELARRGWLCPKGMDHPVRVEVREAHAGDSALLARLAAETFPDAAPDYLEQESIEAFIQQNLTEEKFRDYIAREEWLVVLALHGSEPVGYTLCLIPEEDGVAGANEGAPATASLKAGARRGPLIELSKFYIRSPWRSSGASTLLFDRTCSLVRERVSGWENPYMWLGTNMKNKRAQKAYKRLGFERVGTRHFRVGDQDNSDVVFARTLNMA